MMTDEEKAAFLEDDLATQAESEAELREWADSIVWVDADGNEITPEFLPETDDPDGDNE